MESFGNRQNGLPFMYSRAGSQSQITGNGRAGRNHVAGSHVAVGTEKSSFTANKYSQTDLHLEEVPITVERSNGAVEWGINNNFKEEQDS